MTTWAYLDHDGPIAFAHRGGAGAWPENTMPAFGHAVDLGYRYVETDVHTTADGALVAFHDDRLDRVTDRHGLLADLPWREVKSARVDGREPIPLLEELLGNWPDLRINIDPKHDAAVTPLAEVIERFDAVDRVCVGSFSDRRIRRIRRLVGERLCTSPGPVGVAAHLARSRLCRSRVQAGAPSYGCLQVPPAWRNRPLVDDAFIAAAHRRGVDVHVWTIDEPDEMRRLLDLGVDGVMTDLPEVLKDVLIEREDWPAGPPG